MTLFKANCDKSLASIPNSGSFGSEEIPNSSVDSSFTRLGRRYYHYIVCNHSQARAKDSLEQREQAGLARPTSSSNSLRVPMSPFRRSPSQQSFSTDLMPDAATNSRESLAELWSDFLRREAQESTNMSDGRDDVRVSHRTIVDDDLKSPKTT